MSYLCYSDTQLLVPMHDNAVVWRVKDVCNPRADIREETHWIPNEIGRTENAVQLPQDILTVVVCDTIL